MALYNRYIPSAGTYTRVPEEDAPPFSPPPPREPVPPEEPSGKGGLSALLQQLKLNRLDTGDVLLLLILLFLFLEGDDLELILTLGLLLLLGLD